MRSDPSPETARTPASLPDGREHSLDFTPVLVRVADAAALLAVSERTLWRLTKCEAVPSHRVGRSVRYARAELAAWV